MSAYDPWDEAAREGIHLRYATLPAPFRGSYYRKRGVALAVLAHGLSRREERCVLAEEVAHHHLTVGDYSGPVYSLAEEARVGREERRVRRLALRRLLSEADLAPYIRAAEEGGDEPLWLWAEEQDVTEDVLRDRLAELRRARDAAGRAPRQNA